MKKCPNCKVKFKTNRLSCPFCHKILEDIPGDNNYQEYPKYQQEITPKRIPLKICIFLSLIAIFVTILINFLTLNKENPKYWFAIVIGGLIFLWILVGVTIISKNNIALKIILQAITIGLLLYAIEINTDIKGGWSVIYVIPFIIIGIILSTSILTLSIPKKANSYILYLFTICLIGIVPFIICLVCKLNPLWPSLACLSLSGFTIIGIFLFGYKIFKEEINKKLHM